MKIKEIQATLSRSLTLKDEGEGVVISEEGCEATGKIIGT